MGLSAAQIQPGLESLVLMAWASLKKLDNQYLNHHVYSLTVISELQLQVRTTHLVYLVFENITIWEEKWNIYMTTLLFTCLV